MTEHVVSEKPARESWDSYFMGIANKVRTRATCDRRHVGAVIVRDNRILTTGYNGSLSGLAHCDDEGHMLTDGHCVRTTHAEANAIFQAAHDGVRLAGATIYATTFPCWECFKGIVTAGIRRVVYGQPYKDRTDYAVDDAAKKLGIEMVELLLDTVGAPAAALGAEVQGAPAAPVAPRLGMTEEEANQLDFGKCTSPCTPECICQACEATGALVCACGGRLIDSCFNGCKGFSLASWRGGPPPPAPPVQAPHVPASTASVKTTFVTELENQINGTGKATPARRRRST